MTRGGGTPSVETWGAPLTENERRLAKAAFAAAIAEGHNAGAGCWGNHILRCYDGLLARLTPAAEDAE